MADDTIRIEFDATLDEFVDVHMRQVRRSKMSKRWRLRSMISGGVVGSALAAVVLDALSGRPHGNDMVAAVLLGGLAGSMCGPLYDRNLASRVRQMLSEQYGAGLPMRCEIELRPTSLWVRQDGVEMALDWTTAEAVEDTADGVEVWFRWGLVVARNRGFATSPDRDRFIEQARALSVKTRTLPDMPSA
jgi:hypothetical protein